jgi:hypothetical protein
MSSSKRSRIGRHMARPVVIAVALSLPGAAAFAEDMSNVVTTRADQNIDQQYQGRFRAGTRSSGHAWQWRASS